MIESLPDQRGVEADTMRKVGLRLIPFLALCYLFEVPSNLAMEKVGARLWIARIMISWGLVGIGSAFASGPISFSIARFLLGAAEAGFFPA